MVGQRLLRPTTRQLAAKPQRHSQPATNPTVAITRDVTAMQNRLRTQEAQTLQANERAAQAISRAAKAEAALAQQASEIAELKQQMAQVLAQGLAQGMQK